MTETFGMVATIGYSLAVVFAVIAVIFFFTQHVKTVHDELTGRTAQREIAEMREGRRGRTFLAAASSAAGSVLSAARGRATGAIGSGSLHVRNVEAQTNDMEKDEETSVVSRPGTPTGKVSRAESSKGARAEMGTTLLTDVSKPAEADAATEGGTTLLSAGSKPGSAKGGAEDEAATEGGTTLLTSAKPKPESDGAGKETRGGTSANEAASKKGEPDKADTEGGTTLLTSDKGGARR